MEVFRPSVQPFLASLFPINPATELANLTLPVLLVQGERDIQIQREDYDALAKARPDAQSLLIATMNHMLKPAPIDREGNIKAYTDPTLQLHPFVVPRIVAFIRSVVVQ